MDNILICFHKGAAAALKSKAGAHSHSNVVKIQNMNLRFKVWLGMPYKVVKHWHVLRKAIRCLSLEQCNFCLFREIGLGEVPGALAALHTIDL